MITSYSAITCPSYYKLWTQASSSRDHCIIVRNPLQDQTGKDAVRISSGNSAGEGTVVHWEDIEKMVSENTFFSSLGPLVERGFRPLSKSAKKLFHWIGEGKVRISISIGAFAGIIVALGFVLFDFQQEEWMLKFKYPEALSPYERYVLYTRDLINQEKYSKAEPILRELVETQRGTDNHADALLLLGTCLERSGKEPEIREQARLLYEIFIEEYPADSRVPSVYMMLAESFGVDAMYEDSNAQYEKVLRIVPEGDARAEVEFRIAQNYYGAGRVPTAETAFDRVQQKYAGSPVGWDAMLMLAEIYGESGDHERAERMLNQLIAEAHATPHAAAALCMRANNALKAGDYEHAIESCSRWLDESSTAQHQADIMLVLGRAYLRTGNPDKAFDVVTAFAQKFPDSSRLVEALVLRGEALEVMGRPDEAESAYLEAARAFPLNSSPHKSLARLYISTDRLSSAIRHMERASQVAPHDDLLLLELAKLYRSNGENEKALGILEGFSRERQLSRNIEEAFSMLVDLYRQLDRPHDAYRTLNRRLGIALTSMDEAVVYEERGDLLADVGLFDDSAEDYRKALQAIGQIGDMTKKIASSLLAAGRANDCLNEIDDVDYASLSASDAQDLLALKARALIELDMLDQARRSLLEAIALPKGEEKIALLALLMHVNLRLKDEEAAARVFELTLKLGRGEEKEIPSDAQRIILEWAEHLYRKGQYARAEAAYSKIEDSALPEGTAAWVLYQQGNCYFHLGDYHKADEAFARLVSEYSNSEWAKFALHKDELMGVEAGT